MIPARNDSIDDILIVDDTPANLRLLSTMLAEQGYHVRPVLNGALALEAAVARPPALILLDIRMPGINGYEVCERLKDDPATREIPIIFISAMDAAQDKVRAFQVGGVDYITKPFNVEEVLARVETHISLNKLRKQMLDANRKMARELVLAGEIQTSFLPHTMPDVPGWQFSAVLRSAREMSGDFYDLGVLTDGILKILIADVVDKGAGAAMFMALSSTLLRTYAAAFPFEPDRVLGAVNKRIIKDTGGQQFVSVFYGVLDPSSGTLSYCNAGHPPPIFISSGNSSVVHALKKTGGVLGIDMHDRWEIDSITIDIGGLLLLYTDGITDASNEGDEFFGEAAVLESLKRNLDHPAGEVQGAILADVEQFVGSAPQHDDIALVVVKREVALE